MTELLSVRGLRVDFVTDGGVAQVLDGINLDVGPGEVVGLVGESGCGKTTLARAILGILPAGAARVRGGEVRFRGADLLRQDPAVVNARVRGKAITFIPQDPSTSFSPLFPVQTQIMDLMKWKSPRAGDGARWPLWRYPRGRYRADREAVLETLRAVQIPEPARALRRLPHEFSGGQRQRLMIAMALLPQPDLIIADEPTTALDVTIQAQILRLLRELVKARGVSVLFTTHDLGTAHEICDRVVVMYAGQEMEAAPTDAFFARPAHPYTRRLLASVPRADGEIRDIPGDVPSLVAPPPGCRFHPRCDHATPECQTRPAHARARPRPRRALSPSGRRARRDRRVSGKPPAPRARGPRPPLPRPQRLRSSHRLDPRRRRCVAGGVPGRDHRPRRRERLRKVHARQDGDGHPRADGRRHPLRGPRDRAPAPARSGGPSPGISSTSTRTPAPRSTRAGRCSTRCTSRSRSTRGCRTPSASSRCARSWPRWGCPTPIWTTTRTS